MKRTIKFSKLYIPAAIFSIALVVFGLVGYFVFGGFNMGVDFRAGINETVQLAIPAMEVTYSGEGNAKLKVAEKSASLVIVGTKRDDKTVDFDFAAYKTVGELASAFSAIAGVSAEVKGDRELASSAILASQQGSDELGAEPFRIHRKILKPAERFAEIEAIRELANGIGDAAVQVAGDKTQQIYVIRIQDKGTEPDFSKTIPDKIKAALVAKFGADTIIVRSTNIVGAAFSKDLGFQAVWIMALAVVAILIYAMVRFKPQFAFGAVLAVIHDALMMVAFVAWTRLEFNTSTIAAILTILGYSINDTIVIFDRIRENRKLNPDMAYIPLLDNALTETLGRTIITTLTTLLCVVTLFLATSGNMKDFALVLIVGMLSGIYSTVYIATAFTALWENISKKNAERKAQREHAPKLNAKTAKA